MRTRTPLMPLRFIRLLPLLLGVACGSPGAAGHPGPEPHRAGGSGGVNDASHRGKPVVIVLSIDGFRNDYLDRLPTPHLARVARAGVRAEALIPVFPTLTFPAHYSIATGLRAEDHGVVANRMYDPDTGRLYSPADTSVQSGYWYSGEPLWVSAERNGMVSAIRYWPGSEAEIGGIRPSYWKAYDARESTRSRLHQVLDWVELPEAERPHLIFVYLDAVDVAGHRGGPDSPEVAAAVDSVDAAIGEFVDDLAASASPGGVFLIILSDHGMASFTPETHVALEELADTVGVTAFQYGPVANLFVSGGAAQARRLRDTLNLGLRGGRAYLRQELPERFGYSAHPRAGDVVVVMEEGYIFGRSRWRPTEGGGAHGWDPRYESMRGLFLIQGPGIPPGRRIPAVEAVQIYRLVADLLERVCRWV